MNKPQLTRDQADEIIADFRATLTSFDAMLYRFETTPALVGLSLMEAFREIHATGAFGDTGSMVDRVLPRLGTLLGVDLKSLSKHFAKTDRTEFGPLN